MFNEYKHNQSVLNALHGFDIPLIKYDYLVDWDGDGLFANDYSDITNRVLNASITRGKDTELSRMIAGVCDLDLNNEDTLLCPENVQSPLYGKVKPARTLQIYATFFTNHGKPEIYPLYWGKGESGVANPDEDQQNATFNAVDGSSKLAKGAISTPLYEDQMTGDAVLIILQAAGWPDGKYMLDDGVDNIKYHFVDNQNPLVAINNLEDMERSNFLIGPEGKARWEDRGHRLKPPHTIPQFFFDDSMASIKSEDRLQSIINQANVTYAPKTKASTLSTLWSLTETVAIEPGATIILRPEWTDLADNVQYSSTVSETEAGTSQISPAPTVSLIGYSVKNVTLSIKNNSSVTGYLNLMTVSGKLITDGDSATVKSEDEDSQSDFELQPYDLSNPLLYSLPWAQEMADYLISEHKDPKPIISIKVENRDLAHWYQLLRLDISDRIRVKNTKLGIDADYHIDKINHTIQEGGSVHEVEYQLEKADPTLYWVLGKSELDVDTLVAF